MSNSTSIDLIECFRDTYRTYFTHISKDKNPEYVEKMVESTLENLIHQWNFYTEGVEHHRGFAHWLRAKTEEYKRLNEYHERFGIDVVPVSRRPGGRHLP